MSKSIASGWPTDSSACELGCLPLDPDASSRIVVLDVPNSGDENVAEVSVLVERSGRFGGRV
jgi:hypothetical protein